MCVCVRACLHVYLEQFSLTFPLVLFLLRLYCGRKRQKRFVFHRQGQIVCIRMSLTVKSSSDNFPPFVGFGE